jgi:hypothetical protein
MNDPACKVNEWLESEISRHKTWRQCWSFLFFATASATVVAGALTTASSGLFGGENGSQVTTTWLAATTTILASLEKVLRLREKWDLHRNIQLNLEMIEMRLSCQLIDMKHAVNEINQVAVSYSQQLSQLASPTRLADADDDAT